MAEASRARIAWIGYAGLVLSSACATAAASIGINGRLDEPEWEQAQTFKDFRVTEPLTHEVPPYSTELRILPMEDALYVAVRSVLPPEKRTRGRSPRDAEVLDADTATLTIDFEGLGLTAWEFTISMSGSQRDALILNQTLQSRDWDGAWVAAAQEDETGWTAEWAIPWSIAPAGATHDGKRTIGLYVSRFIKKDSQRWAFPDVEFLSAAFVHDFHRIDVPVWDKATLAWAPYASMTRDELQGTAKGRAGIDVNWRPNGRNRVIATLLPDFGQVESDDLVLNFTTVETFFGEKRPFFTEGQELFNLGTADFGRLVHTRRIGASPDAGGGSSDVLFAGKYTGSTAGHQYGAFVAAEDDADEAKGRRYGAVRYRYSGRGASVGYLGTVTDRPTLERTAIVHGVDYDFAVAPGVTLTGQTLVSDIRQRPNPANDETTVDTLGAGSWLAYRYQPGGRWQHFMELSWFDRNLDFNDLGYQRRRGMVRLRTESNYFIRSYPDSHPAQSGDYYLGFNFTKNYRGVQLPTTGEIGHFWRWRGGSSTYLYYYVETSGTDDLLSRGHGDVRLPTRNNVGVIYETAASGAFRLWSALRLKHQGLSGITRSVQLQPGWFPTENFNVGLEINYDDSDDWLIWLDDDRFGRFKRHETYLLGTINWLPRPNQEWRLKLQWAGLAADSGRAYHIGSGARLVADPSGAQDFTVSTVGVQLRYRYEFRPLSNIYFVYSRGGDGSLDGVSDDAGRQLSRAWKKKTADQILLKVQYRFD